MKPLLLITVLWLCHLNSHGQDSLTVEEIDRIVAGTDSDNKSTKDVYCDTLHLEELTQYCEESLTDAKKEQLLRYTVKTTTNKSTLTVYYFHHNELIKVLNEERSKSKLLKRRVLYYSLGHVIRDVAEGVHPSQEYFLQTAREKVKELVSVTSN